MQHAQPQRAGQRLAGQAPRGCPLADAGHGTRSREGPPAAHQRRGQQGHDWRRQLCKVLVAALGVALGQRGQARQRIFQLRPDGGHSGAQHRLLLQLLLASQLPGVLLDSLAAGCLSASRRGFGSRGRGGGRRLVLLVAVVIHLEAAARLACVAVSHLRRLVHARLVGVLQQGALRREVHLHVGDAQRVVGGAVRHGSQGGQELSEGEGGERRRDQPHSRHGDSLVHRLIAAQRAQQSVHQRAAGLGAAHSGHIAWLRLLQDARHAPPHGLRHSQPPSRRAALGLDAGVGAQQQQLRSRRLVHRAACHRVDGRRRTVACCGDPPLCRVVVLKQMPMGVVQRQPRVEGRPEGRGNLQGHGGHLRGRHQVCHAATCGCGHSGVGVQHQEHQLLRHSFQRPGAADVRQLVLQQRDSQVDAHDRVASAQLGHGLGAQQSAAGCQHCRPQLVCINSAGDLGVSPCTHGQYRQRGHAVPPLSSLGQRSTRQLQEGRHHSLEARRGRGAATCG